MKKEDDPDIFYYAGVALLFDGVTGLVTPTYFNPCCNLSLPLGFLVIGISIVQVLRSGKFNPIVYASYTTGWIGLLCLIVGTFIYGLCDFERHRNRSLGYEKSPAWAIDQAQDWAVAYCFAGVFFFIAGAVIYALPWLIDLSGDKKPDDPLGIREE